jgi:hypothetical protein
MSARKKPYDEENETEEAWFWVVFSHMGGRKSDLKEIARLLRLGQPIPKIAQNFLADLIDPPRGGGEDVRLVLKRNDQLRKLDTALKEYQKVLEIKAAMERGKGVTEAIVEVMPGKERHGFRLWKSALRWREVLEQHREFLPTVTDKRPPTVTDKK